MEDLILTALSEGDTVLFWVLAAVGALIARLVLGQINSDAARKYVGRALNEVGDAVLDVAKTYVESIKQARADGKLTEAEKAEAKARALAVAKRNIGPEGLKRLAKILGFDTGALDKWLGTKVEAAVASLGPKLVSTTQRAGDVEKTVTTSDPH